MREKTNDNFTDDTNLAHFTNIKLMLDNNTLIINYIKKTTKRGW